MKKYKDLKAVCFVDSTYTMLIYMLVYGKEQFDKTFFLYQMHSRLNFRVNSSIRNFSLM